MTNQPKMCKHTLKFPCTLNLKKKRNIPAYPLEQTSDPKWCNLPTPSLLKKNQLHNNTPWWVFVVTYKRDIHQLKYIDFEQCIRMKHHQLNTSLVIQRWLRDFPQSWHHRYTRWRWQVTLQLCKKLLWLHLSIVFRWPCYRKDAVQMEARQ